jgi:hypothetical protein
MHAATCMGTHCAIYYLFAEAAKEVYISIVNTLFMHAATCMGTHCAIYNSIVNTHCHACTSCW